MHTVRRTLTVEQHIGKVEIHPWNWKASDEYELKKKSTWYGAFQQIFKCTGRALYLITYYRALRTLCLLHETLRISGWNGFQDEVFESVEKSLPSNDSFASRSHNLSSQISQAGCCSYIQSTRYGRGEGSGNRSLLLTYHGTYPHATRSFGWWRCTVRALLLILLILSIMLLIYSTDENVRMFECSSSTNILHWWEVLTSFSRDSKIRRKEVIDERRRAQ